MAKGDLVVSQSGTGAVAQALQRQVERFANNAVQAMAVEAATTLAIAKALCPVDTSERRRRDGQPHLRDTGQVVQTARGKFRVAFRAPYAKYAHYKPTKKGGRSLFLQRAMQTVKPGLAGRVARGMR